MRRKAGRVSWGLGLHQGGRATVGGWDETKGRQSSLGADEKKLHSSLDMNNSNIKWNSNMEELLLELRLEKYKQNFLQVGNSRDISKGWDMVRCDFIQIYPSLEGGLTQLKLKNKFHALKKQYQSAIAEDQRTGNYEAVSKPGKYF
jgi:hypothetical protein